MCGEPDRAVVNLGSQKTDEHCIGEPVMKRHIFKEDRREEQDSVLTVKKTKSFEVRTETVVV